MSEATLPATKVTLDGAQRALTPEATLERMRPHWGAAGITRVADLTGMDSLGIPVAISVRPDSASLVVDSGKGMSVAAAKASAVMESFERVAMERDKFDDFIYASPKELGEKACWNFPLVHGAIINPDLALTWAATSDLISGHEILVPTRCLGYDVEGDEPFARRIFYSNSNGMAAGNTREEAVCAAIAEVIERDATTLAAESNSQAVIKHEAIPWATVQGLLGRIQAAGCGLTVIDATSDIGLPVYIAVLFDRKDPGIGVYRGYGAHLSPEIAMCRAVCEAAQARCVIVAGARDDITDERYRAFREVGRTGDSKLWDLKQTVDSFPSDRSSATFREDVATLLELVEKAGIGSVLMYDFDVHKTLGAHVVRVLIPGLEGYWNKWLALGERGLKARGQRK